MSIVAGAHTLAGLVTTNDGEDCIVTVTGSIVAQPN